MIVRTVQRGAPRLGRGDAMVVDVRGRGRRSDEREREGEEIAMSWEAQYL